MIKPSPRIALLLAAAMGASAQAVETPSILDAVSFGQAGSESGHALAAQDSDTIRGGLDQWARRLLPAAAPGIYGGNVRFTLACDPVKPTYVTVKFWGGDAGEDLGRLLLFVEGKQLGVRHLGDVDILDIPRDAPRYFGRFFYKTLPLPREMTRGKTSVQLEIRALGRMWGYGTTWEQFQKPFDKPSRGIYGAFTHTDGCFVTPSGEGLKVAAAPVRQQPGPEVLDRLKLRVNGELKKLMDAKSAPNQMQMQFLARGYWVGWTAAYRSSKVVNQVVRGLDALCIAYQANPKLAQSDPVTPNPDWFGVGPAGNAVMLLAEPLKPAFDEPLPGGETTRRAALGKLMLDCRDWHRAHRRQYTNQSMINDLYGIYFANRALKIVEPAKGLSEEEARRYLYESLGLEPWVGSDTPRGPEKPLGGHYFQLTAKGLTRELGYVGAYGEVLDWATSIYDATRPAPGEAGDRRIKEQLVKICKARAAFREPFVDSDGKRAMALETVVGWRDTHYPGDITYEQRPSWDGGPEDSAAATLDPELVGYAQQMIADHQYFATAAERMRDGGFRVTAGLLGAPDAYQTIVAQPGEGARLPMTSGAGDYVFSDEEDGVVAIRHGEDVLYASLYWRARYGINFLARLHFMTPTVERDATVWEEVQFDDSGKRYRTDDRVIEGFGRRFEKSGGDVKQALEGEVLPIAKVPEGVAFKPGEENAYAGKGTFYTLRYGRYLVGMNMTTDRTFDVHAPGWAMELVTRKRVPAAGVLKVGPRSTIVLYFEEVP